MSRPYPSLVVVALLTAGAASGGFEAAPLASSIVNAVDQALRLALLVVGALAMRSMWQHRATAARLVTLWAALALSLVAAQDVAVGFFRSGLPDRLLATALLAAVLGTVVWRARRSVSELE